MSRATLLMGALLLAACPSQPAAQAPAPPTPAAAKGGETVITPQKAIDVATAHIAGKVTISPDSTLEVEETDTTFVVEWRRHIDYPGPDYDARIVVDKKTGAVVDFLVGG
ncbi:MAG: hypothetical protein AMXMBFR64_30090 [Myxococcales bacterium]